MRLPSVRSASAISKWWVMTQSLRDKHRGTDRLSINGADWAAFIGLVCIASILITTGDSKRGERQLVSKIRTWLAGWLERVEEEWWKMKSHKCKKLFSSTGYFECWIDTYLTFITVVSPAGMRTNQKSDESQEEEYVCPLIVKQRRSCRHHIFGIKWKKRGIE